MSDASLPMKNALSAGLILILASTLGAGSAAAQSSGVAPPPSGPPVVVPPIKPVPPPSPSGPQLFLAPVHMASPVFYSYDLLPFNFNFDDELFGTGFKPGEDVTVTRKDKSGSAAQRVTADSSGNFSLEERYQWVFCGPNATPSPPPPNFVATGNLGSSASANRKAPACPFLQAYAPPVVSVSTNGGGSAGSGSGSVNPGGVVTVPPSIPPQPQPSATETTPDVVPILPPQLSHVTIQGFGFAPGEVATVSETASSLHPEAPTVKATADAEGRIQVSVPMYVPAPCSSFWFPIVLATGNRGTSAAGRILWHSPLMIACPVHAPPGSDAPVVPGTSSAADQSTSVFTQVALHLQPKVKAGSLEKARIGADSAGSVTLAISYPGGRRATRKASLNGTDLKVSWRVPKGLRTGTASVALTFTPAASTAGASVSLKGSFQVVRGH